MAQHIELNPLTYLTIDTVGEPGNRTFYLQGGTVDSSVSLLVEKIQAANLADGLEHFLEELMDDFGDLVRNAQQNPAPTPPFTDPDAGLFRVGKLGLGFEEELGLVVLIAYEFSLDEESAEEDVNKVSFWATAEQIVTFIEQTRLAVKGGRPICGNCGDPIDKSGHFCPHRNGYIQP